MAEPTHLPLPAGPGRHQPGGGRSSTSQGSLAAALAAVIAGTALLGVATGFLWAALAPRALIIVIGRGSAGVVNPETGAFFAADGWFILLSVLGGLVSGLLAWALAVRRHGAYAMAGILVGGLAAALIASWIGQQSGKAAFNHSLLAGRPGALLRAPLILGGHAPLAFWPLAAGITAGGIEAIIMLRERQIAATQPQALALMPHLGSAVPSGLTGPDGTTAAESNGRPGLTEPAEPGQAAREPDQAPDPRD